MRSAAIVRIALFCLLKLSFVHCLAGESPTFKLDWYGQVKLDAAWDQNPTSHGNYAMWVNPAAFEGDDAQFNMTHRATRFGFKAKGEGFENLAVTSNIEVDFYGTGTENKAGLMVRHAYVAVQKGRLRFLVGQSWDLIAPLNPASLNYAVLWGAGNIQYRRPQFSLFYLLGDTVVTRAELALGAFRNQGDNLSPDMNLSEGEKVDADDDGTDAALPAFQGRLDVTHKDAEAWTIRGGVSGLWSRLQAQTNLGHNQHYRSWAISAHMALLLPKGANLSAEIFRGSNLAAYYGCILNCARIHGLTSSGGWVSAGVKIRPRLLVSAGFALDDPRDADLTSGERSYNQVLFGNLRYTPIQAMTFGLEVSRWQTSYVSSGAVDAVRVEASTMLAF